MGGLQKKKRQTFELRQNVMDQGRESRQVVWIVWIPWGLRWRLEKVEKFKVSLRWWVLTIVDEVGGFRWTVCWEQKWDIRKNPCLQERKGFVFGRKAWIALTTLGNLDQFLFICMWLCLPHVDTSHHSSYCRSWAEHKEVQVSWVAWSRR